VEFELLPYHREDTLNEFDRSTTIIENVSLQDDVSDFFFNLILLKALAEFSGIFMFLPYLLPSPKDQDMSESIYSLIFKAKLRFRKSDHILIWMSKVWVGVTFSVAFPSVFIEHIFYFIQAFEIV
jgi:hypothetical protein